MEFGGGPVTTNQPVWLLDVDGVINARRAGHPGEPVVTPVWSATCHREFKVRWSPVIIGRIRDIHDSGTAEVRWCTTWCGDTATLEDALDLPAFTPCWTEYTNGRDAGWAKLAAAREVLAQGRRLIWTDDSEVPERDWPLYDELTADGSALLIRPDKLYGLRLSDLDLIEAFAATTAVAR